MAWNSQSRGLLEGVKANYPVKEDQGNSATLLKCNLRRFFNFKHRKKWILGALIWSDSPQSPHEDHAIMKAVPKRRTDIMMTGNSDHGFAKSRPLSASVVAFFEEITSSVLKRTPRNIVYLDFDFTSGSTSQTHHVAAHRDRA